MLDSLLAELFKYLRKLVEVVAGDGQDAVDGGHGMDYRSREAESTGKLLIKFLIQVA